MQLKIAFISDNFEQYQAFVRRNENFIHTLDLYRHIEANRKEIYRNYYDLFIVDLTEPWYAMPPWIKEQALQPYFYQFIFISNNPLTDEYLQAYATPHSFSNDKNYAAADIHLPGLMGEHPSIKKTNDFIQLVSKARYAPCLIKGESGSGKIHSARAIHRANNLGDDYFFIKNCEHGTNSELLGDIFGVEKDNDIYGPPRKALLSLYTNGTLVLKNIEKLPAEVQEKLLIYLENRTFRPMGGKNIVEANVRIIGTTKHNLEWFVKHHRFNPDLFYHLNAFEIELLPLRERKEDIFLLTKYFIQNYNYIYDKEIKWLSTQAEQLIKTYKWPGNVNELKNVIERAVFVCNSKEISMDDVPESLKTEKENLQQPEYFGNCSIKELERIHINHVLQRTKGNKSKAAGILDISRTTLREKMRLYEIDS
ncbi:MAG: sigma 54-interacting transcriptional regulator [Calditrichaceae bacterium]